MSTIREYQEDGSYIDREPTAAEIAQNETDAAAHAAYLAELETKNIQRQAILDRIGITEEEAQLIIGGSN
jgi:hypothetical protein